MNKSTIALNNKLKYLKENQIQSHHYSDIYSRILSDFVWSISTLNHFRHMLDWKMLSRSDDVLWSEELLDFFKDELSWEELSCNISLPWSQDFIKKYESKWVWKELSNNTALPFDLDLILEYKDKWHIDNLISNPKVKLCTILLDEFKSKLTRRSWSIISNNTIINWNLNLIEKYKDDIVWEYFTFNGMHDHSLTQSNLTTFLLKYGNRLNNNNSFYRLYEWWRSFNKFETIHLFSFDDNLVTFTNQNCFKNYTIEPYKTVEINFFILLLEYINKLPLSKLALTKKMNDFVLENFESKIDFSDASSMKDVSWNEELISKYEKKWSWNKLINNESIKWTPKMLERFAPNFNWKGSTTGGHSKRYQYIPSEVALCTSSTFILPSEILKKYAMHWCKIKGDCIDGHNEGDWSYFSRNGNITSEIIENLNHKLNFNIISERDVSWNLEEIKLIAKNLWPNELDNFFKKDKVHRLIVWNNLFKP